MTYELVLIAVLVAAGYWGLQFARTQQLRTYGLMLLGAALLAGLGLAGRRGGDEPLGALGILGAIGVGAATCLLLLGPLARSFARRAAAAERFSLAQRLLDVADVLAPGSGVSDEKALVGAMRELRDGNIDRTLEALRAAKDAAPAAARRAIDERIAMLYLAAYRWEDAIAHAEAHLFDAPAAPPDASAAGAPLRSVLGLAPPVWVELLGAYGYTGDLARAALMLARLEDACAGRADAAIWVHRARTMFLALAGRVAAVEVLVEPRRSRHMTRAARTYWIAVAHERRGDGAAAEAAYTRARSGSRGRPRALIDQALARLAAAKAVELPPAATEVVARVEAAEPPVVPRLDRPRVAIATRIYAVTVVAVAMTIALVLGDSADVGVLVRAGAMVRGLVHDGEWWRLISCNFVHVGAVNLVVNLAGILVLGWTVERIFGAWRTAAIYAIAGVAGATASLIASPAGVSAGASAAMFGMLGALFVELARHRRHYAAWGRSLWGGVAVIVVAQLAVDAAYPLVDQWAHGAGLVAGAAIGALLSPRGGAQRVRHHAARAVALGFVALCGVAGVMVVRTSLAESLARAPLATFAVGGITVRAPARWHPEDPGMLVDPDAVVLGLVLSREAGAPSEVLATELAQVEHGERVADRLVALPAGWQGEERATTIADTLGEPRRYRVIVAVRPLDAGGTIAVRLVVAETVARDAPAFCAALVASVQAK